MEGSGHSNSIVSLTKDEVQRPINIDLRSDTVSLPVLEMRLAMANAIVGDDVYNEDPTVKKLEQDAALLFGKEAGLFVSSGTQGNLLAFMSHCNSGETVLLGNSSHTVLYERGGVATIAGLLPFQIQVQPDGTMTESDILTAINWSNGVDRDHASEARLIVVENTHNSAGGVALPVSYMELVGKLAKQFNLKYHVDGARIFNAATALGVDVKTLTACADSITFCLSKGLCAPAGSVLVGSKEFITKARQRRKMLGGGMRQSGVLAAAGLIALHVMSKRLHTDHENAKLLGQGLQKIKGIIVLSINTNFVWFRLSPEVSITPPQFRQTLAGQKILMGVYPDGRFRCTLHYWITSQMVEKVLETVTQVLSS